jgi:DNA-binding transcriptional ArsR family regulator
MNRNQLTELINNGCERQLSTDEIVDGILALAEADATWAKALSHPLRGNILRLMRRDGTLSPIAVSREIGQSVGTIAYHFRQLHKLGYIEVCDERQRRGATEHVYRLTAASSPAADSTNASRRSSRIRGDHR